MFEEILLTTLKEDTELISYLSTYTASTGEVPSIFSNSAPAKAEFNYMLARITDVGNDAGSAIDVFLVTIDVFGYSKSGASVRNAVKRVIKLLDTKHISDSYYNRIRFYKSGSDYVETDDPKSQHYNIRFTARASRSGWMSDL